VSFVSDIVGAFIGQDSNRKAVHAQTDAANADRALQQQQFDQARSDNAPLLASRNSALDQINALLANPSGITSQPGYQFGLDQGTQALNAGAAARGMTYSGAAGKALTRYGQDYAGTKLDQSYNRLSNLAGLGQVGANNNQTAGQNFASNVGQNMLGVGNAQAGAALSNGRGWSNAVNSLGAYGDRNGWFGGSGGSTPMTNGGGFKDLPNYLITGGP
jgi:hypothetical protein